MLEGMALLVILLAAAVLLFVLGMVIAALKWLIILALVFLVLSWLMRPGKDRDSTYR